MCLRDEVATSCSVKAPHITGKIPRKSITQALRSMPKEACLQLMLLSVPCWQHGTATP
eukprot:m.484333 g.484333  ORF g.484333 m.484333 type:complete len:58 (-) comp68566_c0_seq1:472-645(-)